MISINVNESKKLRFKISLSGIQAQDLRGSMKIMMEGIEYGFPIEIDNGDIVVDVNPISEIYSKTIKDGALLDAKLELIAGDNYLSPWQDKIKIDNPVKLEAKVDNIVEEIANLMPKVDVSIASVSEEKEENEEKKEIPVVEEKKNDKPKSRFSIMLEK